ncbi:Abortive infection protein [Microbacterium testaceum]|nr:Abortive infection protein [Microbacterium testaceum]
MPRVGAPRRRRERQVWDWRLSRTPGRTWDPQVLAVSLVVLGAGVFGGGIANRFLGTAGPVVSSWVLWVSMAVVVALAFVSARPRGLLKIRSIDLLWGVALGTALRLVQGWLSGADHNAFPSPATLDGQLGADWWLQQALPAVVVAPLLEEFVFRGVILVAVFQILRRGLGPAAAGATALLVSAAAFVLLHGMAGVVTLVDGIQLFAIGAVCALVVLLSGRIWGAVLVHLVYNLTYLALALTGFVLS